MPSMYKVINYIIVLTLAVTSSANPVATTPKPGPVLAKRTNQCGPSTFPTDGWLNAAPYGAGSLIEDCETMVANIQGDGSWGIGTNYDPPLVTYGTCQFAASSPGNALATIGNQDIIDLVYSVLQQWTEWGYPQGDYLYGAGSMPCQLQGDASQTTTVNWIVGR